MDEPIRDEVDVFVTGERDDDFRCKCQSVRYCNVEFDGKYFKVPIDGVYADLKPCPFCGSYPVFRMNGRIIECSNKACEAGQRSYKHIGEAIYYWNRRVGC